MTPTPNNLLNWNQIAAFANIIIVAATVILAIVAPPNAQICVKTH
jgi:hypothetical protein